MTAKEIREFVNSTAPGGSVQHEQLVVLGEIAAQLAELNERIDREMIMREVQRDARHRRRGK